MSIKARRKLHLLLYIGFECYQLYRSRFHIHASNLGRETTFLPVIYPLLKAIISSHIFCWIFILNWPVCLPNGSQVCLPILNLSTDEMDFSLLQIKLLATAPATRGVLDPVTRATLSALKQGQGHGYLEACNTCILERFPPCSRGFEEIVSLRRAKAVVFYQDLQDFRSCLVSAACSRCR